MNSEKIIQQQSQLNEWFNLFKRHRSITQDQQIQSDESSDALQRIKPLSLKDDLDLKTTHIFVINLVRLQGRLFNEHSNLKDLKSITLHLTLVRKDFEFIGRTYSTQQYQCTIDEEFLVKVNFEKQIIPQNVDSILNQRKISHDIVFLVENKDEFDGLQVAVEISGNLDLQNGLTKRIPIGYTLLPVIARKIEQEIDRLQSKIDTQLKIQDPNQIFYIGFKENLIIGSLRDFLSDKLLLQSCNLFTAFDFNWY
ncbi:UNKNOWN [Stylonychia lemnae]|uniref:Uncharacterized protein n=1 Tax=Stylonychia lemnae TaxID=5949 RepID=A0A078AYR0_STYLE|nr:UNKNOWN [Stylonychia lemnae]|eukprot:CDW85903.1 UNKNOWN [Stylonychia lemnae]